MANSVLDKTAPSRRSERWSENDALREADRIALAKYGPPGVVIDDELNIIQFRGHTSPFLEAASGVASLNLLSMAREGLSIELRNAIHKARQDNAPVRREGLRVRQGGQLHSFDVEVVPFRRMPDRERLYLLTFETAPEVHKAQERVRKQGSTPSADALEQENAQLRQDLASAHDYLKLVSEEKEATNEELRSANEEIQSSNEELQSTNEEMETAKEELQSTNEELNTVNEELQTRNLQLIQAGNDLMNLLSNVNMPIVMLGNDLRIRRFTPVSERILNLIPADVGQPITRIKFDIESANIQELLLDVVENLSPKTVEVRDAKKRRYSLRIRPYRTEDNKIDGVVMMLVDLDPARLAQGPEREPASNGGTGQVANSLRAFTQRLLAAQEEERRRIARELHDEINQMVAVLEMELSAVENNPPAPEKIPDSLRQFRVRLSELSDHLRGIAYQLHPSMLDDLGLVVALESFCTDFSQREGIGVRFERSNVPATLDRAAALEVYRIAQEALRNVARHSGASHARVSLETPRPGTLRLRVIDEGIGFHMEDVRGLGGLGLTSMEERAAALGGHLKIESKIGTGTQLELEVPLAPLV